jgi:tetratricopeptide (TPR) repeat protein
MYNEFKRAMPRPYLNTVRFLLIITVVLSSANLVYAQSIQPMRFETEKAPSGKKDKLDNKLEELFQTKDSVNTELEKTARMYRQQGMDAQRIGNINVAAQFYQKAIEIAPNYPVAYNDLGVLMEGAGQPDRAEQLYLKSIQVDPNYLSAYTNLAMLYETKRELDRAAQYWDKRAKLGDPEDPWTLKAKQRLSDLNLVLSKTPVDDIREQEIINLTKDIANKKDVLNKSDAAMARDNFAKAKRFYEKGDLASALKKALDARQLDPSNDEIENFIEKVQRRALTE